MDELTKVINEALAMVEQAIKEFNETGDNPLIEVDMQWCTLKEFEPKKAEVLLHKKCPEMKHVETRYFENLKTDSYEMQHNGVLFKTNNSTLVKENE